MTGGDRLYKQGFLTLQTMPVITLRPAIEIKFERLRRRSVPSCLHVSCVLLRPETPVFGVCGGGFAAKCCTCLYGDMGGRVRRPKLTLKEFFLSLT